MPEQPADQTLLGALAFDRFRHGLVAVGPDDASASGDRIEGRRS